MKNIIYRAYVFVCSVLYLTFITLIPIRKRLILFESNMGKNYSGNPKYIYEEMISKGSSKDYLFVWVVDDLNISIPGPCIKVRKMRIKYLYFAARAQTWIFDSRQPALLVKRKNNIFIQTWHGTPLKKLALDMEVMNIAGNVDIEQYKSEFKKQAQDWDYLISQNQYSTEIFKRCFAFNKSVWEVGYPRNDNLIFLNNSEDINWIKRNLDIDQDKKIILYAPTWRDDEYDSPGQWKFNLKLNLNRLKEQLGNEYILIIKMHYFVDHNFSLDKNLEGFVRIFKAGHDIQQLYLISDILITDYSSVMFDYSLTRKPMIFFVYDITKYEKELRGFYFDLLKEAPGPIVYNEISLIESVINAEQHAYLYNEKYEKFIKKYNHLDDGYASKRVIEMLNSIIDH
ncbi:CDP-glycerol glycerophosphotransferase family protein [Paenibacillus taichungensis]|uniref:CDP-glycerol glycerophosphotransferase family protein n=1 Tax=Paenibacillus taichungensis TaxID=484184 RepID=UPI002DB6B895|nr:CDP-glycerol glycerophosphotransferase family protein [Paenibacillus taichungensis]MEC0106173.1 CDP-glycerol glycerophosphotransferase family protein [Paenibacillus taichungensis]MEC0199406.1 CDP-glycerol glycerophosphotransferase family protein [Paenibacillus taichungensis]